MSKTVLVTGANGFVGQHLIKELHDNGMDVIGVGGSQGAPSSTEYLSQSLTLDLTSAEETNKIDFAQVDSIIHLAGLAAVGPSFDNPMLYINTNMGIETNLFEAAQSQNVMPRFLIISSGSLYDAKASLPLTENSTVVPSSPYAISKLGQEQMGSYYGMRGFEYIVARPFNHIGPGQGLGFIVPDLTKQVVDIERGIADQILVGNLDARRDYTDVRDIVQAYRLLIEHGKSGETYNICSGKSLSGQEILSAIIQAAGISPKITTDQSKMRPADNPEIYGGYDKLFQDTGWEPTIDITTTLEDVLQDWRTRN